MLSSLWYCLILFLLISLIEISFQQSTPASASPGATTSGPTSTFFPSASAPLIVVNNSTLTPTAYPIALPTYNGPFIVSTSTGISGTSSVTAVIVISTEGNFSTGAPATFFGGASNLKGTDSWLALWVAGMLGLGAFVHYL